MTPASELKIHFKLNHTKRRESEIHGWYRIREAMHTELTAIASRLGLAELAKELETMSFKTNPRVALFYESKHISPYAGRTIATSYEELEQLACDVEEYLNIKKTPFLGHAPINRPLVVRAETPERRTGVYTIVYDDSSTVPTNPLSPAVTRRKCSNASTGLKTQSMASTPVSATPISPLESSETIASVKHVGYLRGLGHYTYLEEGVRADGESLAILIDADKRWDFAVEHDLPLPQKIALMKESGQLYKTLATHYLLNKSLHQFFISNEKSASVEVSKLKELLVKETPKSTQIFFKTDLLLSEEQCALDIEAMRMPRAVPFK